MLLLRTLIAVFVLAKTPAAAHVVDIKFDPSLKMPEGPRPDKSENYTVFTCLESLENDPNVAFSADQVLSNEEDFPWASQGWSKVSRVWPQGVVEVLNASQKRAGGGLGGLGPDGTYVMATEEQMNASLKTLRRLIACCRRTNTLFTMRSGGHCNAGCSSMGGTMTFGIKGLNIVKPKVDFAKDFANSLQRPWESPGTVEVGAGADAGQAAYMTFNESFRHDPNHPLFRVANVPVGFAGGLPVGQKPTVGMAGLTLGGGFGFHTRYAGLLCDRLIALDAVNPDTAEIIHATKDNEHSELVWAACGGGGGNYAAVTKFTFQMMPICVVPSCTVIQLQHYMPQTLENLLFFQEWSLKMDPRITANLEVFNSTTVTIAGIWMGSRAEFNEALTTSGLNETTPFTVDGLNASATEVEYTQALINLNGWEDVVQADSLTESFLDDRSYFQYLSLWLLEELPREAMDLLIKEANWAEGNNSLVYEFQTLGGPPGGTGVPDSKGHVWPNAFSSVDPTSTAFPHRNARHCLMFKANSDTQDGFGPVAVMMRNVFKKVAVYVRGQSPYYNHMDTYFSGVDQYFVAGVETLWEKSEFREQGFMPWGMKVDKHYYLDRLRKVRAKYNFFGAMTNVRQVPLPKLPPATNDGEQPWKAAAIALGSVLATVLLGAAVFWVVHRASGNAGGQAGGVEVEMH